MQEVLRMAFQIKPNRKETENKTIRFPVNLIQRIEEAIVNEDVTFSAFVIQACEYALENMEKKPKWPMQIETIIFLFFRHMLVSRGIGNSIIPFRFNNRPEVILIELASLSWRP